MRCNQELYGHINCDRDVIQGEKFCKFHYAPSLRIEITKLENKVKELEVQLEKAEGVLKYYADGMNYSLDSYEGISGEMRARVVLYGDSTEINDVASQAGRRAREYFQNKEIK